MLMTSSAARRGPLYYKLLARETELNRLRALAKKQREEAEAREAEIVRETAARALKRPPVAYFPQERVSAYHRRCRVRDVLAIACKVFEIPDDVMTGRCRRADVCAKRAVAAYVAYRNVDVSLPQIGLVFRRDHSTILHAIRKIERLVSENDPQTVEDVNALRSAVLSFEPSIATYWGA